MLKEAWKTGRTKFRPVFISKLKQHKTVKRKLDFIIIFNRTTNQELQ